MPGYRIQRCSWRGGDGVRGDGSGDSNESSSGGGGRDGAAARAVCGACNYGHAHTGPSSGKGAGPCSGESRRLPRCRLRPRTGLDGPRRRLWRQRGRRRWRRRTRHGALHDGRGARSGAGGGAAAGAAAGAQRDAAARTRRGAYTTLHAHLQPCVTDVDVLSVAAAVLFVVVLDGQPRPCCCSCFKNERNKECTVTTQPILRLCRCSLRWSWRGRRAWQPTGHTWPHCR